MLSHPAGPVQFGSPPRVGKILVADDDPELLLDIAEVFRSQGHEVVAAKTGEEVLRLGQEHLPDMVILNLDLSGQSAHEVCHRLLSDRRIAQHGIWILAHHRSEPVFILTSESPSGQRAIALGAIEEFIRTPLHRRELARRVTIRRLGDARYSSPLTGLPGDVAFQEELQRRLRSTRPVALLHLDVDHFKAYNDRYGYKRGDEAIRMLAAALRQAARAQARQDIFLGHLGGDDFVVLAHPNVAEEIANGVVSGFRERVIELYDPAEAARGWIEVKDRTGRSSQYGLLTLSIGVAISSGSPSEDPRPLVEVATEMKRYAKSRTGNTIAVARGDQRRGADAGSEDPEEPLWPFHSKQLDRRRRAARFGSLLQRSAGTGTKTKASEDVAKSSPSGRIGRRILYPAVLLLTLGLVAGSASVAAAQNARPGEPLWPLRLATEEVQLFLEQNPQRDVGLHLEFASRRVADLEWAVAEFEDPSVIRTVTEHLARHTGAAVLGLRDLSENEAVTAALRAQTEFVIRRNLAVLQELVASACSEASDHSPPEPACGGLRQAVVSSQESLEVLPTLPAPGGNAELPIDVRPPRQRPAQDPTDEDAGGPRSASGDGPGGREVPDGDGPSEDWGESDEAGATETTDVAESTSEKENRKDEKEPASGTEAGQDNTVGDVTGAGEEVGEVTDPPPEQPSPPVKDGKTEKG